MPKVTIDGVTLEVPEGTNVVRAAELAEKEVPHYCYHPGLSVAGNCRMCLVEIKALSSKQQSPLPKLQIGCNTVVQDGMVVETANERVQQARRSVLEFLLINHPIDCPICDQAGECKLQEYYMDYGRYRSRFPLAEKVEKRKVIPIGPDVMLDQERCILCTRCVRFLEEFSGTHELCITQRGDHSELTLADGASVDNPYAGNIVDICPVGALTSREFRFQARVWYLHASPSICAGCATGCNVHVHSRGDQIYRLKPRYNPDVNGYWICDFGRRTFEANASEDRLRGNLLRATDSFTDVDADTAVDRAARALGAAGGVAAVVSAALSMEEGFLIAAITEQLGGGPLVIISPASCDVPDDGKLISTDRFPNRRGLLSLGYVEASHLDADVAAAILARCDPAGSDPSSASWLEALAATIVVDERVTDTTGYADVVLAAGSHFESEGTFVNRHGRMQRFEAAVKPPGDARPGWQLLAALLAAVGGPRYTRLDDVFEALAARLAKQQGAGYEWLGEHGRDVTGA